MFLLITVQSNPNISFDETIRDYTNFRPFHFTIAAFHLRNTPMVFGANGNPVWGTGKVEQAWYTMARCDLERAGSRTPDELVCLFQTYSRTIFDPPPREAA